MSSKAFFNEIANQWDEMRTSYFSCQVREKAFELAHLEKGKIAADIGAGTGFITEGLLANNLNVIALDQSEEMLSSMQKKFSGYDNIEYKLGSYDQLPIEDSTVDYVFASMFLHHVEEPLVAIKEMARILRPGGKLIIADAEEHPFEFLKTEHYDAWLGFKKTELREWLLAANLNNVDVKDLDEKCIVPSKLTKEIADINILAGYGEK
ncbi:MAG: class I SAM-dependent methyltransferase [Acidobacteria bacterium]|nr:class I SAM-dependent methyltransferase [Acidobacteriota bacterium]